jgi:hypothetical protein
MMNYQRQLEPAFSEKLEWVREMCQQGYQVDHISIYSCDANQAPQDSP